MLCVKSVKRYVRVKGVSKVKKNVVPASVSQVLAEMLWVVSQFR